MDEMMSEVQTEYRTREDAVCVAPGAEQLEAVRLTDVRELGLKEQNLRDIAALQAVMATEEGEVLSTQEVLRRVLGFYNRFVPFMQQA